MNRTTVSLLASLSLIAACAGRSSTGSTDPSAGEYSGYYGEQPAADGGQGASSDANRPKPRAMVGTRGADPRKGVALKLIAKKPPRNPGSVADPSSKPLPTLGIAGFVPTAAGPGTVVHLFGGGFAAKPEANTVKIGKTKAKVLQATEGFLVIEVPAGAKDGSISVSVQGKTVTTKHQLAVLQPQAFGRPADHANQGLYANVYSIPAPVTELPAFDDLGEPFRVIAIDSLDIPSTEFAGFSRDQGTASDWYALHLKGSVNVTDGGEYDLCLASDDGTQLYINETPVIDNDGVHEQAEECALVYMEPGEYQVDILYFQATGPVALQWTWSKDGGEKSVVPTAALFPPDDFAEMGVD